MNEQTNGDAYIKDTMKAFNDFKNKQKEYKVMFFDM